jgi:hypothetical protein
VHRVTPFHAAKHVEAVEAMFNVVRDLGRPGLGRTGSSEHRGRAERRASQTGCPLIWKSQIQSSIALSTFHSEYAGLSHSMRILIPLRGLLLETVEMLDLPAAIASTIYCRVHEDNASALLLANSQHLNNRNKYLAVKLHHFWSHVKPGIIDVVK